MKAKKFSKKLTLNKATIVDLDKGEMNDLNGGAGTWRMTGYPCCISGPVGCISVYICRE